MKTLVTILSVFMLSSSAFATLKVECAGLDASGRSLDILIYSPNIKPIQIPNYQGAEYYAEVSSSQKKAIYALTSRQILTGHFVAGATDFGDLKSVQDFDGGKLWTGILGGIRFRYNDCKVLILVPESN